MAAVAAETAEKHQRVEVQSLQSSPAALQRVDQVQCSQAEKHHRLDAAQQYGRRLEVQSLKASPAGTELQQVDRHAEKHQRLYTAQQCRCRVK